MDTHATAGATSPDPAPVAAGRRRLAGWMGLAVRAGATVALMAYALRGLEWKSFQGLLANAEWRWWVGGLVILFATQLVSGIRWAALARPLGFDFSRGTFIWRFLEGSFFSLCLPSSIGGDVIKAYRLGDDTARRLLAGCSILADRLTGLTALGVLASTALIASSGRLGLPATLLVAVGLLAAAIVVFRLGVGSIDRILDLLPAPHPAREFIARLLPYQQRPSLMSQALGWSFVVQIGGALAVGLIARSLGVIQPVTVWFAVVPLVALATVLPISINGVGVRENALAVLLAPHGVAAEPAVAVGLLWLFTSVITGLVGGALFLLDRRASAHP
jgi:uncharacterized membrane protein YbhN (UPF0104 family)